MALQILRLPAVGCQDATAGKQDRDCCWHKNVKRRDTGGWRGLPRLSGGKQVLEHSSPNWRRSRHTKSNESPRNMRWKFISWKITDIYVHGAGADDASVLGAVRR